MPDQLGRAMPRVYLAGPGVFRPDAGTYGRRLKEKCAAVGLLGCFPLDGEAQGQSPAAIARAIFRANVELLNASRAVVADISPFRGPNMDPGTAWEIGYAAAKGLPVFAWSDDPSHLFDRTRRLLEPSGSAQGGHDHNGWEIENFALVENLMIAISVTSIHRSDDEAIEACAAGLGMSM
ncbi:MAG: nucleoside 2-deoxyribosyltransferase [Xanthobacteraceae bacterium]|nr:nucleoside 2-deoxyribosyltransferase [Xanthobacteraceae bacterium]